MRSRAAALGAMLLVAGGVGVAAGTTAATTSPPPTTAPPPATTAVPSLTAPVTSAAAATTATTLPVAASTPLFPSVDAFVAAWNEQVANLELLDPTVETQLLDVAAFAVAPLPSSDVLAGGEAFVAPLSTNGLVGGMRDPSGAVGALVVTGDPDSQLLLASVGALLLSVVDPAAPGVGALFEGWDAFAADYKTSAGDYLVASDVGVLMQTIPGAEPDDELISVVAARAQDEVGAFAQAYALTVAVATLSLQAPEAPSTAVATTAVATTVAPVTTMPATVQTTTLPPAVPATTAAAATTGLPTVSIGAPGVTAPPFTTLVPPSTVPLTTAAPVPGKLFASLDDMTARWNERAASTASSSGLPPLTMASSNTALIIDNDGTDVFGGRFAATETALFGGVVGSDDGPVEAFALVVNPFAPTSLDAVTTAGHLTAEAVFPQYLTMYTEMITATPGEHRYLAVGEHDIAIGYVSLRGDDSALVVVIAPVTDEPTAVANLETFAEAIFGALTLLA